MVIELAGKAGVGKIVGYRVNVQHERAGFRSFRDRIA